MGLFDNYQFDQQSYGGGQGGLLDLIRSMQQAPQPAQQQPANYFQPQQPPMTGEAQLPPNAQPAMGQPQYQQQPMEQPGGFRAGLEGFINNAHTGPIGALLGGVGSAMGMDGGNNVTVRALMSRGLDRDTAIAAARNPTMLAQLVPQLYETKAPTLQETGTDPLTGQKSFSQYDARRGTLTPIGGGQAQGGASGGSFLAKGIGQVDSSLAGEAYLKQFSPEVQAAVTDYVSGKTMPTGNARQGFTQAVKMIAQKYGNDIGAPADDTSFSARRTMRNQLSSSAPSSLGGQINIGNTAAAHLADLTRKALDLGNYDMGLSPLTSLVNNARGLGTEQAAKMDALKGAAQHYGQEITKFYAGSPGGVAERDRFLETVNGAKSPKELAAVLATEAELMHGRLNTLGDQIKGVLGPLASEYPVVRPDSEKAFATIQENVAKLKGGGTATAPTGPQEGATATGPNGVKIMLKGGKWVPAQ